MGLMPVMLATTLRHHSHTGLEAALWKHLVARERRTLPFSQFPYHYLSKWGAFADKSTSSMQITGDYGNLLITKAITKSI